MRWRKDSFLSLSRWETHFRFTLEAPYWETLQSHRNTVLHSSGVANSLKGYNGRIMGGWWVMGQVKSWENGGGDSRRKERTESIRGLKMSFVMLISILLDEKWKKYLMNSNVTLVHKVKNYIQRQWICYRSHFKIPAFI